MNLFSNAKINIGLSVLNKREDGFHNIESLFLPIPWYDEIKIVESNILSFTSSGLEIDSPAENNLCLKAYHLFQKEFKIPTVQIHLTKQIPIGAGLGGGSSNAAFVLKGLNKLFDLNLSIQQLEMYADKLGSDCSFFIQNIPALVRGKGEQLNTDISFKLSTWCLVVYPSIHISTQKAYHLIKPTIKKISIEKLIQLPMTEWQGQLLNDFEEPMLREFPELKNLKIQLNRMGASYISMSGSGSTFFALFEKQPIIKKDEFNCLYELMPLKF